jgi:NAD(P)-dependent dehydrogenase (short-subunit alcohol dehydrogenase family)
MPVHSPPIAGGPSAVPRAPAGERLLEDKVAVVTGGAVGIGAGIALAMAAHGARVVIGDVDEDGARQTAEQAEAESGKPALARVADVRDRADVTALADAALAYGDGRVDVLVNNVGEFRPNGLFVETDEEDWEHLYGLNLKHIFRCTRTFLPTMIEQGSGSIVNVSSVEGFRGIPNNAVYSAFKAGAVNFTRSLAAELGVHGIRVNGIAPDLTDTPQLPLSKIMPPEAAPLIPSYVPVGRFGRPDDHGDVAVFLASEQARFVNGQTICVDGGTMSAPGWFRRPDGSGFTNMPKLQ